LSKFVNKGGRRMIIMLMVMVKRIGRTVILRKAFKFKGERYVG
jgi:hypothetical protein